MSKFIRRSLCASLLGLVSPVLVQSAERPSRDLSVVASTPSDPGRVLVDVRGVPPPAPLFFSATAEQVVTAAPDELTGEIRLTLRVVQGRPEVLTLGLSGEGEVVGVSGKALRDWAVRQGVGAAEGRRFLDLRPELPAPMPGVEATRAGDFEFLIRTRLRKPTVPGIASVLLLTPADAVGFATRVKIQPHAALDVRVASAAGVTVLDDPLQFHGTGEGRIELKLMPRGAAVAEAELTGAQLSGRWNEAAKSVDFKLRAQLRAVKAGARLRLLSGRAALSEKAAGDGWHVELVTLSAPGFAYDLVADREGHLPVDIAFSAQIREDGDWRALEFAMPAGAVVPLELEGLGSDASFKTDAAIVPSRGRGESGNGKPGSVWRGFLPADGGASLAWKQLRDAGEGALAFTSFEQAEVRIGAGLLRQVSQVAFRVLQGKLSAVRLRLDGPGEVLGVEGSNVLTWKVVPESSGGRVLEVRFSRPAEADAARLTIQSQVELGAWPVRVEPLRLTPEGGVRHSGFVRIANSGAVRLEVAEASGMMQLAPGQFPGAAIEAGARQVFVYRFPAANYGCRIVASPIQPEVAVSGITTHELSETVRVLQASIELEVREAALRDWTLRIPENYTVVSVTGSGVADYVAEAEVTDGTRALRVLFAQPVDGRQLLQLRLERNQPAAAGEWSLPPLQFPGAKSVRGHVGVVTTPGFRIVPVRVERLVEVPLSFFPQQTTGLQQAWRVREPDWSADVRVEALGQSVQADLFHLTSLKEGVMVTSVLLNYFVVGAPASEWRIEVPAGVGNLDVIGQNVRRDWRREGDQLIVSLHQPVLGAATLLVTFEQPLSARGGAVVPGLVRPVGVQAERGFIQIVSPLQVKHQIRRAEGALLKLEPTELPAEYRLLTSAPSLAVYHYTGRPFGLELGVEWYAPGEMVDQVVDFAKLTSQVSRDGQVVTEAIFFVKTRGRKALRLVIPAGMKLWEARVDHELVNARADGEQTLIPLPPRLNPNEPAVVALRLGQPAAGGGSSVKLAAPRAVATPTVINEWVVRGDAGRLLVPRAGNAAPVQPGLTETGFEWIAGRAGTSTAGILVLALVSAILMRDGGVVRRGVGLAACLAAVAGAGLLAGAAMVERRPNLSELAFAATVVPENVAVLLEAANLPVWRAMLVAWGVAAILAGVVVFVMGWRIAQASGRQGVGALARSVGVGFATAGLLAQHGGAVLFFCAVAAVLAFRVILPGLASWRARRAAENAPPLVDSGGGATAVTMLVLAGVLALGGGASEASAQPTSARRSRAPVAPAPAPTAVRPAAETPVLADGTKPLQTVVQAWSIRGERLFGEIEFSVRGGVGESFLLLRAPAVLTEFKADGLRVGKVERDGKSAYYVAPERDGLVTGRARFELAVTDRNHPLVVPTGPAAVQRIVLELDQGGWEFVSPAAVQVIPMPDLSGERSGATLVLAPHAAAHIQLQPRRRDLAAESTQFVAETANLFLPGPGVVNGIARVTVRPVQGRVSGVELEVPRGFTVGDVSRGPVGAWRFDPQTRRLSVAVEPAQTAAFRFEVEMQLGAGELPFALSLAPVRVVGAAGDVGMMALGFGPDAQPEGVRATELSAISVQDFDTTLLPRASDGQPVAVLQQAWRYGPKGGGVELKIAAVAPEVRVMTKQVLSLDDDRVVMAGDLRVAITRGGLFKLSFPLPEGFEVEALTGTALNQWTESHEGGQRIVTLHLNGRTTGEHTFALALAGAAPRPQEAWAYPRLRVREATRQTGEVLAVPGKGIRLRATARERVTQLDPRAVGGQLPGTLAFRLLQEDWVLNLGIEALEPWVTVQALQEVTLREGQTLTRLALRYRVENSAVKQLRLRLPGLSEENARTVRAVGPAVSDLVKVTEAGVTDTWEVRFQRGVAGETDVQVEFQGTVSRERGQEAIVLPELVGARQVTQFVAVRSGGQLELGAPALPRGWARADWSAVPGALQNRSDRSVPAFCFRVAEPEGPLTVTVRRHEVAEALKLRVTKGELMTLFAPGGASMTAVDLNVDVLEKSLLRVRLPAGARLFNTFVNGESVSVVREGDAWLFHVFPHTAGERSATVKLVYAFAAEARRAVALTGPSLSVPLENVTWRVVIPPGYELDDYAGGLRLQGERLVARFGLEQYQSLVSSKRSEASQQAQSLLQQASSWLQKGEQEKASEALSRVSNGFTLDQASNEDARVQLRNLKTQQAVVGLNTRRQRMYLDNRADAQRNESLEQAVNLNPFMQGKLNYNPQQVDQLLLGNSAEENTALRGIAARIVDQQLAAEPAPGAIDVTLPERGQVLVFTRSLQVDGGAPLELRLDVIPSSRVPFGLAAFLVLAVAAVSAVPAQRRSETRI